MAASEQTAEFTKISDAQSLDAYQQCVMQKTQQTNQMNKVAKNESDTLKVNSILLHWLIFTHV